MIGQNSNRDEWESTFQAIPDIVVILDPEYRISRINRAGYDLFKAVLPEPAGRPCHELFGGGVCFCAECGGQKQGGKFTPHALEMHHERLDRTFSLTVTPVANEGGGVNFVVLVARDITNAKKLEQQLILSEKMTTIAGLAAGVAHEINTPLSAILQSIQVVQSLLEPSFAENRRTARECGLDLEQVNHYFQRMELDYFLDGIRNSALNASRIITTLLDFSRPRKGDLQEVDINRLLDNSLELARADYNLKKKYDILNIAIHREYGPDLPPVSCVPMEIEQVVLNLAKNAVQAMADHPSGMHSRITLRTMMEQEGTIRVEVEDNGPGIEESEREHIFDPFYTTREIGAGTGLGLSVARAIVQEKHGGRILVESGREGGARFVVLLPVCQKV